MKVVRWLRRTLTWLVYLRRFGRTWAAPLADNLIWPLDGATIDSDSALTVSGLGISLPRPSHVALMLLRARHFGVALHERAGATLALNPEGVRVTVDGLEFITLCEADLGVLHEIFVERLYAFESPGPFLVVDIGTNIGAAALYFARHLNAEILCFELVPSTADIAERNFHLNPELEPHIKMHRFGLADRDVEIEIQVSAAFRPGNSLYVPTPGVEGTREKVQARDAGQVLGQLVAGRNDRKLVIKIDAEGAEYEIMRRLSDSGLLDQVEILFLEWHARAGTDPEELRSFLRKSGFRWFERCHPEAPVGMITAYRTHD